MIRVAVADDHPIVLNGLEQILRSERDFQLVASCTDGDAILDAIRNQKPDVAIVDLRMPRRDGVSVAREAKRVFPEVKLIILTAGLSRTEAQEAIAAGTDGIIFKETALTVLVDAVRKVISGEKWLSSSELNFLLRGEISSVLDDEVAAKLTSREAEIVTLLSNGIGHEEIAKQLGINAGSLRIHLDRIQRKTGIQNQDELGALVIRESSTTAFVNDEEAETPAYVLRLQRRFGLTPREAGVAALLAQGMANKEIAEALNITLNTVKTHVAAVHAKTDVSSTRKLLVLLRSEQ